MILRGPRGGPAARPCSRRPHGVVANARERVGPPRARPPAAGGLQRRAARRFRSRRRSSRRAAASTENGGRLPRVEWPHSCLPLWMGLLTPVRTLSEASEGCQGAGGGTMIAFFDPPRRSTDQRRPIQLRPSCQVRPVPGDAPDRRRRPRSGLQDIRAGAGPSGCRQGFPPRHYS